MIAGAGPTGLTLGAELKRLGIPSLILDRLQAGANTSRAAVVHARILEVLEPVDRRGIAAFYPHEIKTERDYFLSLDAGLSRLRSKPTLIFWGSKDPGFLGSDLARWEKALPYHRTIMLPNANHFFFEDATQQVTDETRRFLTGETENAN